MAKKTKDNLNPWILFAAATVLLMAGWLMKTFPVLLLIALAPLFAIADQAKNHTSPWNRFELILLALIGALLAAHVFNLRSILLVLIQAIVLTLAFVGYAFAYQNLGTRLGIVTIIFFWLGLEYVFLKTPWHHDFIFLADALQVKPAWHTWTRYTGYLGVSCWILLVNLFFYLSFFRPSGFSIPYLLVALIFIIVPLILSFQLETPGPGADDMHHLYGGSPDSLTLPVEYKNRGELVARTATWISVLIILLSFVKNKTRKR